MQAGVRTLQKVRLWLATLSCPLRLLDTVVLGIGGIVEIIGVTLSSGCPQVLSQHYPFLRLSRRA